MCKIVTLTNLTKIKSLDKFINVVMSELSCYEKDGMGYAIQGEHGVFGERTTNPESFSVSFKKPILNEAFVYAQYNRFGIKGRATGSGMFHGRTSTNDKTLLNTHPIQKHDWTLIHNGVVTNHGPKYKMITTNDTEHVLEHLANEGIHGITKHLTGYYGVCAFSPDDRLHVFKDSIANLFISKIDTIDSYIIATTEALIKDICKTMKWEYSIVSPMTDNTYLVFSNNVVEKHFNFEPRGSTRYEDEFAEYSLGRKLESVSEKDTSKPVDILSGLTEDEKLFLEEVKNYADSSYVVKNWRGDDISITEFKEMPQDEQLMCTVVREDGTIVDPFDYHTDKLYQGAM